MTDIELLVLEAAQTLRPNAYGVPIHGYVSSNRTGSGYISYGSVYMAIESLLLKRFISVTRDDPTPERGGRPKLFVEPTPEGLAALSDQHEAEVEGRTKPMIDAAKGIASMKRY